MRHGSSMQFHAPQSIPDDNKELDRFSPHDLLMNCAIRVLRHLGCPHGCSEGIRGPHADFCRSQSQMILSKLHKANSKQFARFWRSMMREQPIPDILDFFHAFVGFCVEPSSLLSPLSEFYFYLHIFLIFSYFSSMKKMSPLPGFEPSTLVFEPNYRYMRLMSWPTRNRLKILNLFRSKTRFQQIPGHCTPKQLRYEFRGQLDERECRRGLAIGGRELSGHGWILRHGLPWLEGN